MASHRRISEFYASGRPVNRSYALHGNLPERTADPRLSTAADWDDYDPQANLDPVFDALLGHPMETPVLLAGPAASPLRRGSFRSPTGRAPPSRLREDPTYDPTTNKRVIKHNSTTYMLAPIPPSDAPAEEKSLVLEDHISTIQDGEDTWLGRANLLTLQRYNSPATKKIAAQKLANLLNVLSPTHLFRFIGLQDENFAPLPMPPAAPTAAQLLQWRQSAKYAVFSLTIQPHPSIPVDVAAAPLPSVTIDPTYIELPRPVDPTTNLPTLEVNLLPGNISHLPAILGARMAQGLSFDVSAFQTTVEGTDSISLKAFKTLHDDHFHQCLFEVCASMLVKEVVGSSLIKTPSMRLSEIKQVYQDPATGKQVGLTIAAHYDRFSRVMGQINLAVDTNVNLPLLFYNSLDTAVQKQVQARNYQPPNRYANMTEQYTELIRLKGVAEEAENAIASILEVTDRAMATRGRSSRSLAAVPAVPTMMATPPSQDWNTHNTGGNQFPILPSVPTTPPMGVPPLSPAFHSPLQAAQTSTIATLSAMIDQAQAEEHGAPTSVDIFTVNASAESALRTASGLNAPIECWGCKGSNLPEYQAGRFHFWRDCPNKADPRVVAAAAEELKKWQQKQSQRQPAKRIKLTPSTETEPTATYTTTWAQQGYPSQRVADIMHVIATTSDPNQRRQALSDLTKAMATPHRSSSELAQPNTGTHTTMLPILLRAFSVANQNIPRPIMINTTRDLPHGHFPIGLDQEGKFTLMVCFDTGAGASIGDLEYHRGIFQHFPSLVAHFGPLPSSSLKIGGIESNTKGIELTHMIEYHTPFRSAGTSFTIAIALGEGLAITAILGLAFMRKAKATISFDSDLFTSPELQTAIPLQYMPPSLRSTPQDNSGYDVGKALLMAES